MKAVKDLKAKNNFSQQSPSGWLHVFRWGGSLWFPSRLAPGKFWESRFASQFCVFWNKPCCSISLVSAFLWQSVSFAFFGHMQVFNPTGCHGNGIALCFFVFSMHLLRDEISIVGGIPCDPLVVVMMMMMMVPCPSWLTKPVLSLWLPEMNLEFLVLKSKVQTWWGCFRCGVRRCNRCFCVSGGDSNTSTLQGTKWN